MINSYAVIVIMNFTRQKVVDALIAVGIGIGLLKEIEDKYGR